MGKLLGAACVMLATIGYTGYLLEKQKLHRDVLQALISVAEMLSGYIGYERLTMEEALRRLSGSCHGVTGGAPNDTANALVKGVLAHMADRLAAGTDGSAEAVWRGVFSGEAPKLLLREDELSVVLEMGKGLGGADIGTQLRCLQGGAHRLEETLAAAGRELAEKRRLYRYLGVAVGALAVLVLI